MSIAWQGQDSVPKGIFAKPTDRGAHLMFVTGLRSVRDGAPVAALLAVAAGRAGRPALVIEAAEPGARRLPGPFSTALSRGLSQHLEDRFPGCGVVARGGYCHLALPVPVDSTGGEDGEGADRFAHRISELADALPAQALCLVAVGPDSYRGLCDREGSIAPDSVVVRGDPERDRSVLGLAVAELHERGIRCKVWKQRTTSLPARLATVGLGWGGASAVAAKRILGRLAPFRRPPEPVGSPRRLVRGQAGQALPMVLGLLAALVLIALIVVAIGGAVTGKGRAQRAVDLAAVSAARSLRDDLPRRLSPAVVNGVPNPYHLSRGAFLDRARQAAYRSASANDASPLRMRVSFPDHLSPAPLRARVTMRASVSTSVGGRSGRAPVRVSATAAASVPLGGGLLDGGLGSGSAGGTAGTTMATGGGYSGPLAVRQGKGMRPDVAAAFDLLAAAAARAGHHLTITSAFRSDEEQARLFAANPDPRWVAPPGQSLHRCATELDLGPSSAYGWLAANAPGFGFIKRYDWEAWHFGFDRGPAPCSSGDALVGFGAASDGMLMAPSVPSFVPAEFAPMIQRAAAKWDVSSALLAAQLQAESNFNPNVVSSAGAQGIAQFMPGTAASYGLSDPFDPASAIMAQAQMMSDLLRQFGSTELALAAYNAGPGAVGSCNCIPPYAETIAYVEKITSMLAGLGTGSFAVPLEVRLVS